SRVPDALQRPCAAAQSRDPEAARHNAETWAPALQRTVEVTLRCVRGARLKLPRKHRQPREILAWLERAASLPSTARLRELPPLSIVIPGTRQFPAIHESQRAPGRGQTIRKADAGGDLPGRLCAFSIRADCRGRVVLPAGADAGRAAPGCAPS